jgi:hypothetical protein
MRMDPRSVVRRRVTADPSPFSPSFSFRQLLQTSFLFQRYSSRSFFTSGRESDPGKSHPSHSFGCKAHSWRCILFARVAKRSLTSAFLLFLANLSGTNHYHARHCDWVLGRLFTCYMSLVRPFASSATTEESSVIAFPRRSNKLLRESFRCRPS